MLTHDSSANRLLIVAAASAAASSLLTYSVIRWRSRTFQHAHASRASLVEPSNGDFDATLADPYDPSPRAGHLVWDDYFMAVAFLSAQRSKDPNKQVGACIVDRNNIICGIGYNGFPRGCPDSRLPWAKKSASGNPLETKYPYVCHAEMNAILNKNGASVEGAKVFVTMFPCNECAKLMIQAGISEIVYHEAKDQPAQSDSPLITSSFNRDQQYAASRRLLALAGVKLRHHLFQQPIVLRLTNDARWPAVVSQLSSSSGGDSGGERSNHSLGGSRQPDDETGAAAAPASTVQAAPQNGGLAKGEASSAAAAAAATAAATRAATRREQRGRGKRVGKPATQQQPEQQQDGQQQRGQQQQQQPPDLSGE